MFGASTNCENMAHQSFRSEKCSARGVRKKLPHGITGLCRGLFCLWELQHAIFEVGQYKCRVAGLVCQCPDALEQAVLIAEMLLRACVNAFFWYMWSGGFLGERGIWLLLVVGPIIVCVGQHTCSVAVLLRQCT